MAGESRTAAFIKRNPLHKVPTLDDGNGLVLGESNAILRFICNTYKSLGCELYPMEPAERGLVDMALDFRLTTMYVDCAMSCRETRCWLFVPWDCRVAPCRTNQRASN